MGDQCWFVARTVEEKPPHQARLLWAESIAAERVFPGSAAYNASKHGALGFTNTLREELRPKGIRVIALLPGATATALWNALWPKAPRRKMMSAETVARAVVYALLLPDNTTAEKIVVVPSVGTL